MKVNDGRPATHWVEKQGFFEICFPKSLPPAQSTMIAGFHDDLIVAFKAPAKQATLPSRSNANDNDEGFTEIDADDLDSASIMTPATTNRMTSNRPPRVDALPDINELQRPEELFNKPPYHMVVHHSSYGKEISIQCSHQPSLDLMSEYFKRWVKRNHNQTTKPPAAEITMMESCFGLGKTAALFHTRFLINVYLGLFYDRLEFQINSYDHRHGLSPALILHFVESVLGYRMTFNDASRWTFRRDTALR
jgi:hypothetical protein